MQCTIKITHSEVKSATITAESNSGLIIHKSLADVVDNTPVFYTHKWTVTHKLSGWSIAQQLNTRQQARQLAKEFTSLIPLSLFDSTVEYNDSTDVFYIKDNAVKIIGANIVRKYKA